MSYSFSGIAIRGRGRSEVLEAAGFVDTGREVGFLYAPLSVAELPSGWLLIVWDRSDEGVKPTWHELLSKDCETVGLFVEEHVMFSQAVGYADGAKLWSVVHDPERGEDDLEGQIPPQFEAIQANLRALEAADEEDCVDYLFDGPADLVQAITGLSFEELDSPQTQIGFTRLAYGSNTGPRPSFGKGASALERERSENRRQVRDPTEAIQEAAMSPGDEDVLAHISLKTRRRAWQTLASAIGCAAICVWALVYWAVAGPPWGFVFVFFLGAWFFGGSAFTHRGTYAAMLWNGGREAWIEGDVLRLGRRKDSRIPIADIRAVGYSYSASGRESQGHILVQGQNGAAATINPDDLDTELHTLLERLASRVGLARLPDTSYRTDERWIEVTWSNDSE